MSHSALHRETHKGYAMFIFFCFIVNFANLFKLRASHPLKRLTPLPFQLQRLDLFTKRTVLMRETRLSGVCASSCDYI